MSKKLSNSFSTGGGGHHFESHIQACFFILMITGGRPPCLPSNLSIEKIKLQGKITGYNTDDLIVFAERDDGMKAKLLAQVKHSVAFTKNNTLAEILEAAWKDFNNKELFKKGRDSIAIITGAMSKTDHDSIRWIIDQAKFTENSSDFFYKIERANFGPINRRKKLDCIRFYLNQANKNAPISDEDFHFFLKHFGSRLV